MEWNGMEWNGMEWNGMEWNGMEWNGMEGVSAAAKRGKHKSGHGPNQRRRSQVVGLLTPPASGKPSCRMTQSGRWLMNATRRKAAQTPQLHRNRRSRDNGSSPQPTPPAACVAMDDLQRWSEGSPPSAPVRGSNSSCGPNCRGYRDESDGCVGW
jgi:hypothetical protein